MLELMVPGYKRSFGGRVAAMVVVLLLVLLLFGAVKGLAQTQYGLKVRVPNISLLVDLTHDNPPATILASDLFTDIENQLVAPGIIPYGVNAPLWSDGAYKTRYLALPGDSKIGFSPDANWTFPANTVLVKSFYLDVVDARQTKRRIVENRLLVKVGDTNEWRGFSYQWNEAETNAELLSSGARQAYTIVDPSNAAETKQINYIFPAPEDCGRCHTYGAGQVLGVRTAQLNGMYDYADASAHQLATLNAIGLFTEDIGTDYSNLPRWVNPLDEAAPLALRARSYLQTNCAHCHLPGGLRRTEIDLRFSTPLTAMGIVDEESAVDDFDSAERRILRPGEPDDSVLLLRTLNLGQQRMPPVASNLIDVQGTSVLRRWIASQGIATHVLGTASWPLETELLLNYPNPFNTSTTIRYRLAADSPVTLAIYDILGQRVRQLAAGYAAAGSYAVIWDGLGEAGDVVASGIYLLRLQAGPSVYIRRLTLIK